MALEIPMEDIAKSIQERNNERLEILKAKEFKNHQEVGDYGANKLMDPELYDAAIKGDVDNFINKLERVSTDRKLSLSTIFERASPSGNSLLHEVARFGNKEIVELIAHHFPSLLTKKNIVGDTALHIATKAEKSNIIDVLIKVVIPNPREETPGGSTSSNADSDANVKNQLLRMENEIGNTALHEAVINGDLDGVKCLLSADNQVAYHLNSEGKSPLCLAVETGNKDILELLLDAPVGDGELVGKSREESPVYAAIIREKLDILEEINKKNPMLFHTRDLKGKTPLHFTASIGYLEGVRFLLKNFSQSALERSKKGDFPIHMASKKGHVEIVKELLQQQWPDPTELLNNEGQNILHVAAKNGRKGLVQYLLRNPQLDKIFLNAKDKNGNTPLHLASMNLHPNVLVSLTGDKRVDLKLRDKYGLTAVDVLVQRGVNIPTATYFRKFLTGWLLNYAGTPLSEKGIEVWRRRTKSQSPKMDSMKEKILKDRISLITVVAILVATVTFAASFTVPGGFNSSDQAPEKGMATLINRTMFHIFIICDTVAMYCSIIATFALLWAHLGDFNIAASAYFFARDFTSTAVLAMSVAFISATYILVSELTWLAIVVVIMGIIFLAILFVMPILMMFPFGFPHPAHHFIDLPLYTIPLPIPFNRNFSKRQAEEKISASERQEAGRVSRNKR